MTDFKRLTKNAFKHSTLKGTLKFVKFHLFYYAQYLSSSEHCIVTGIEQREC